MTDDDRRALRELYDLQVELFHAQGNEIIALKSQTYDLQRAHDLIAKMLEQTAKLMGLH